MQSFLKPILYGLESIDGWLKTNYGFLWCDKTTRNVGSWALSLRIGHNIRKPC